MKNLSHAYDEYLKARADKLIPAILGYPKRLEATKMRYGRFAIPTFYKPHLLTLVQERLLKRVASALTEVINTAARLYFEESHFAYTFRVDPQAAELIKIDPGFSRSVVFSRFDALLEGESLKVMEFNCDCPAGAAYADQLETMLRSEIPLKEFFEEYQIQSAIRAQGVLEGLLGAYEEFGGTENPQIAIVDWRKARTYSEFEHLKVYFESKGYKTTIVDPRELRYKGGKLYHKDFRVHVIYRRALFEELLERLDEVEDMIRAYRDRAVCMVNPLRARLASSKAFLSVLTNPEYDHYFTEAENRIKREHIPWTRRLIDAEEFYGGKKVYLIDFLKDEKETLILKPSSSFGGRDVVIGRETPDDRWNETIDRALKGDWVVQEFVNIPIMTVPVVINNKLDLEYKKYNFNMFVFGGKYIGGLARLSNESVINVAKGGGLIPSLTSDYMPDRRGG